jgi:hypothetical protein
MRVYFEFILASILGLPLLSMAQPAPTSQPLPPRLGMAIERLNDYVSQLNLSDDQKTRAQKLFADTRQRVQEARQQAMTDAIDPMDKVQGIVQDLRLELADLLTPEQLGRLRELIAQGGGLRGPGFGRGPGPGRGRGPDPMMQPPRDMQVPRDGMMPEAGGAGGDQTQVEPDEPMIERGRPAPDFSLKRLEAGQQVSPQPVRLSSIKTAPTLLVFGSFSSPSLRQRAAGLEQLRRDFNGRVHVYLIYTRENHPTGQRLVERNKETGIAIEQPSDQNGRVALAARARMQLKLTVPILIDTMDDSTAHAYGASSTNAAYLIGGDGVVVAVQRWFEPYSMRRQIEEVLKLSASTRPADPAQ